MPRTDEIAQAVEEEAASGPPADVVVEPEPLARLISTGCTLLNLALSDDPRGGWAIGKLINLVGDSHSGKTAIALACMAEACQLERFDGYELYFDDAEAANEFDITKLFGPRTAARIKAPAYEDGEPLASDTVEEFENRVTDLLDRGTPFIYILDSLDALDAEADIKKAEQQQSARKKEEKVKGSYGMAKPKKMSEMLRRVVRKLKRTASILIIISQTRDAINTQFPEKTRAGGRALKFYASAEVWTAVVSSIKRKDRPIGIVCRAKVKKTKLTGKVREIEFPILYDYGIDDLYSCVDFLVKEGYWTKSATGWIDAPEMKTKALPMDLVVKIEKAGKQIALRKLVWKVWQRIEDSLKLNREPKYK